MLFISTFLVDYNSMVVFQSVLVFMYFYNFRLPLLFKIEVYKYQFYNYIIEFIVV